MSEKDNGEIKLINLTPHSCNFLVKSSKIGEGQRVLVELPPSGVVARVIYNQTTIGRVRVQGEEIQVLDVTPGKIVNLPDPQSGVLYLVSKAVAEAVKDRDDLLILFGLKRTPDGRVLGGTYLSKL